VTFTGKMVAVALLTCNVGEEKLLAEGKKKSGGVKEGTERGRQNKQTFLQHAVLVFANFKKKEGQNTEKTLPAKKRGCKVALRAKEGGTMGNSQQGREKHVGGEELGIRGKNNCTYRTGRKPQSRGKK